MADRNKTLPPPALRKEWSPPDRKRVSAALAELERLYPQARCGLDFANPLQLLVATILSAQCTDERVNKVTPVLFARFPQAADLAAAGPEELEGIIRSTGFFHNKAKSIRQAALRLVQLHQGQVPDRLEDLLKLPGVGRKTANVVLGDAFGVPGITVDTHLGRVSRRLDFTNQEDPVKAEFQLMDIIPQKIWTSFSHQMILHGRRVCKARSPRCGQCSLYSLCPGGPRP